MLQFAGSILVFVFATALAAQVTTGEIRGVVVDLTGQSGTWRFSHSPQS